MLTVKIDEDKAYLKSNMDRFIEIEVVASTIKSRYLKSNMDRFIGQSSSSTKSVSDI